jgi:hypothetical protein
MTTAHQRAGTATVLGLVGCVLLAGCSSGSDTHADVPAAHANSGIGSSSPADPVGTAGTTGTTGTTATPPGVTSSAAAPANTSICALITEQEASTALGADPGPGEDTSSHGASSCVYGTAPMIVTVNLVPSRGKAAYDQLRARAPAGRIVDIAGIGDAAFGTTSGPAAGVDFYKGDAFVAVVLVAGLAGTTPKDQAIVLAKAAAARI